MSALVSLAQPAAVGSALPLGTMHMMATEEPVPPVLGAHHHYGGPTARSHAFIAVVVSEPTELLPLPAAITAISMPVIPTEVVVPTMIITPVMTDMAMPTMMRMPVVTDTLMTATPNMTDPMIIVTPVMFKAMIIVTPVVAETLITDTPVISDQVVERPLCWLICVLL